VTLDDEDIEAIAERVAEKIRAPEADEWVKPQVVVARLKVSKSFLYRHADELGALRVGGRGLRFNLRRVQEGLDRLRDPGVSQPAKPRRGRPPGRSRHRVKLIQPRGTPDRNGV
jgi:hypothetical protein